MNMIEITEHLKDYSNDQLMKEMKAPSGSAPQFLVLSELQRRKRMKERLNMRENQNPQTVAQEEVSAAGIPSIMSRQFAQGMAPNSDITKNTARGMADGGIVGRQMYGSSDELSDEIEDYLALPREVRNPLSEPPYRTAPRAPVAPRQSYSDIMERPVRVPEIMSGDPAMDRFVAGGSRYLPEPQTKPGYLEQGRAILDRELDDAAGNVGALKDYFVSGNQALVGQADRLWNDPQYGGALRQAGSDALKEWEDTNNATAEYLQNTPARQMGEDLRSLADEGDTLSRNMATAGAYNLVADAGPAVGKFLSGAMEFAEGLTGYKFTPEDRETVAAEANDDLVRAEEEVAADVAAAAEGSSGGSGGGGGGSGGGGSGGGAVSVKGKVTQGADHYAPVRAMLQEQLDGLQARHHEEKWMAMAKFGLGLMSSNTGNFGTDVGNAGQGALEAFAKGKADIQALEMDIIGAQIKLAIADGDRAYALELALKKAALSAGKRGGVSASKIITYLENLTEDAARIEDLEQRVRYGDPATGAPGDPARADQLRAQAADIRRKAADVERQYNIYGGGIVDVTDDDEDDSD